MKRESGYKTKSAEEKDESDAMMQPSSNDCWKAAAGPRAVSQERDADAGMKCRVWIDEVVVVRRCVCGMLHPLPITSQDAAVASIERGLTRSGRCKRHSMGGLGMKKHERTRVGED